jgi:hypothetical protein|tara:strand:+ start:406 stop:870 length:465 start_codon:yes stop_codon:yes gene_type:complete
MNETNKWLIDYGNSHQNVRYPLIFWSAVILFPISLVGALWSIEMPVAFYISVSPVINWGLMFLLATIIYYFIISIAVAIGMIPFIVCVIAFFLWLENMDYPIISISIGINIMSIYGLYRGRGKNTGLKSLWQDIQMMIIGPLWMLSRLYKTKNN